MELKDLVGQHILDCAARTDVRHPFNADANGIAWSMDEKIYMAFEDANDGYRSSMASLLVAEGCAYNFWDPDYLGKRQVTCRMVTEGYGSAPDVLEVIDVATGHVWLRVGTADTDDYYPWFVAEWHPLPADQKPSA